VAAFLFHQFESKPDQPPPNSGEFDGVKNKRRIPYETPLTNLQIRTAPNTHIEGWMAAFF
jgi:hypothetical protein